MKRKIDFVLTDNKYSKTIFRFYPRSSSVHGFGDEPPRTWDAVYKVYYNFAILEFDKYRNKCRVMFDSCVDESSCIDSIAYHIKNMNSNDKDVIEKCYPSGDGVSWMIEKWNTESYDWLIGNSNEQYESYYDFFMWNYSGKGYKFQLKEDKAFKFAEAIDEYLAYMLEHSQGI